MVSLAAPLALLLLPLPLLAALLPPLLRSETLALSVPSGTAERLVAGSGVRRAVGASSWWTWMIWVLLVVGLAGPTLMVPVPALPVSGRDLMVALDLSGSMVREDFSLDGRTVTRMEPVQAVGAAFLRGRAGDRVGLVVFGAEAYVAVAPTFDVGAVVAAVEEAVIGIFGRATNISNGLGLSLRRLEGSDAQTRVVILLSDGANNGGAARPADVARLAAEIGVRIHTIAMGPESLDDAGADPRGAVDTRTLAELARASGGQAFRVRTTEDLREVTAALDALEATPAAGMAAEVYRSLWIWPAAAAALLLALAGWRAR